MSYESYIVEALSPGFLRGRYGERLMRSIGSWTDALIARVIEAHDVRLLDTAPPDTIPYAASDSNIQRYALETFKKFLAQLKLHWKAWPTAGTRNELIAQFEAYDIVHVNAEFADQASDHDPQVARFVLDD